MAAGDLIDTSSLNIQWEEMVTPHPFYWMPMGSRRQTSAGVGGERFHFLQSIHFTLKGRETTDSCLFVTGRSRIVLGSVRARAPGRGAHSSDQAGCQTNRWSQQRGMLPPRLLRRDCDRRKRQHLTPPDSRLLSAQTWRTHDHTPDRVCQQRQQCHHVCRGKTEVGGGGDLTVQSCCSPQITVACFQGTGGGGGGSQSAPFTYHVYHSIVEVNYGHYGPQGQNPIT